MIELDTIYNEDCLECMKRMPDKCVDLVITSPPYNKAGYEGFIRTSSPTDAWSRRNIDYAGDASNDFMPEDEYEEWQIAILNECYRLLKDGGSMFYNHKVRMAQFKGSHPMEWIVKSNFTFRQQIVWDRGSSPALAPIRYIPTTELIFWLTKGAVATPFVRSKETPYIKEVWNIAPQKSSNKHPAPFPEAIPLNILMNFPKGIVLDPFSGSGTTLAVAKRLGWKYIGIEKQEQYAKMAETRIKLEQQQQTLF